MKRYLMVAGPAIHPDERGPMVLGDCRPLDERNAARWVADGVLVEAGDDTSDDNADDSTTPAKRRARANDTEKGQP